MKNFAFLEKKPSNKELFLACNALALQGFGGVMAVAHRTFCEQRKWLSDDEFLKLWSVSQALPGPNIINMVLMFGDRCNGILGALAALSGLLLVPWILMLGIFLLYQHLYTNTLIAAAMHGMGAVAVGLILGTGLKLAKNIGQYPLGWPFFVGISAATVFLIVGAGISMAIVLPMLALPTWMILLVMCRKKKF